MNFFDNILFNPSHLSLVILALPLLSFILLFFFAYRLPRKGDILATILAGITFSLALILVLNVWGKEVSTFEFFWFKISSKDFRIGLKIDDLSAIMLLLVSFISFLVHLYSLEYMKGKRNYARYFPYLGIFTFSMIGIVISNNLLITFMFWELVGFSSYLLIGFWYDKEAAVKAAKKAFLFNRIGDTGFIIALIAVFGMFGSFDISYIHTELATHLSKYDPQWLFWIGLGIFMGCVGKSAQFPLQAWLPDAMEGPTPVSALIHAATMVAAGVYLLIKVYFLLAPDALTIIAFIGAITAIMGALPALFQNDIKKVLAYSTISQLGYMIMAVGVGAFDASFFHLITHGFFKACLFLSAGAVIHSMHHLKHDLFVKGRYRDFDSQDMRLMGGFKNKMPVTFICYLISAFALIGLPLFSGFLSKDAILESTVAWAGSGNKFLYVVPAIAYITVFITAVYMIRQIVLVFFGEFRLEKKYEIAKEVFDYVKDPSFLITGPLLILSLLCLWIFFSPNPLTAEHGWLFQTGHLHISTALISVLLSFGGIALAYWFFRSKGINVSENELPEYSFPKSLLKNNWYLDRIYYYLLVVPGFKTAELFSLTDNKVIDGVIHFFAIVNVVIAHIIAWFDKVILDGVLNLFTSIASRIGYVSRSFQAGRVQGYFVFALITILILIVWIIIQF